MRSLGDVLGELEGDVLGALEGDVLGTSWGPIFACWGVVGIGFLCDCILKKVFLFKASIMKI